MNKLAKQSCILAAAVILICLIGRLSVHNTYTSYVPINMAEPSSSYSMADDGEGDGRMSFEEPQPAGNYVRLRMRPDQGGEVGAELRNENGEAVSVQVYYIDRFGTVFDRSSGGFTGDTIVMIALTIFFLAESLLVFLAFRRARGASFYAYSTIFTAGFSLFLFLTGLMLTISTVRHMVDPGSFNMMNVYSQICAAGYQFMMLTFPLILIFAVSMTVSNIALLRHERPRPQNALGILVSVLMVAGAVGAFMTFGAYFSGSETEYRILNTIQNVYCTAYAYFECMLIGAIICGIKAAKHVPEGIFDYIIILGCSFRKDGTLTPLLQGRVDRAIGFWKDQRETSGKTAVLIPSGGQGSDETMSEAEAMHRYLVSREIPEEYIMKEDQSRNTYQNMEYSGKLIGEKSADARILFSTTNYHVFRSGIWASLAGVEAEGIGSRTKWWFWPNAFMRECAGLLVNRWKQEILLLIALIVLFGVLSLTL